MQYAQELKEYQQTEAYQITSAKIQDKRIKRGDSRTLRSFIYDYFLHHVSCDMHVYISLPEDIPSVNHSTGIESSLSKVYDIPISSLYYLHCISFATYISDDIL